MTATAIAHIRMPGLHVLPAKAPKSMRSEMETMIVTPDLLSQWKLPKFQRPLNLTNEVRKAAEEMQLEAGKDPDEAFATIQGVITLGRFERQTYLVDGQHRLFGSFAWACRELLAHGGVQVKQALINVRQANFDSMKEMADEFVMLNSQLNKTKPDDVMRAIAEGSPAMAAIEKACPYIGYDLTGENKNRLLLSMSAALRVWNGSGGLVPAHGPRAQEIVSKHLNDEEAKRMIDFFGACEEAGWVNTAFKRLWSSLNLGIVMWMWRRLVLGETRSFHGGQRPMVLTREQFVFCMRELLNEDYLNYLVGRSLRFQDRVPTYARVKELFTVGLIRMGIETPRFPMPQGWTQ